MELASSSSRPLPSDLLPFLDICGNAHGRTHFVAMRFKRAIVSYTSNRSDRLPVRPADDSIWVIRGSCPPPPPIDRPRSVLVFSVGNDAGIRVPDSSECTLLHALFPREHVLYSHYKNSILYVVASRNPHRDIMKRCRRDNAFRSLVAVVEAKRHGRLSTLEEIANLRFFKRAAAGAAAAGATKQQQQRQHLFHSFNRWSPFVFHLCFESVHPTIHALPSESIGREIYRILKRTCRLSRSFEEKGGQQEEEEEEDSQFYRCELYFTTSEPVGILCLFSRENGLCEYVSPMVVRHTTESFRDTNFVVCDTWLPLYRNGETWKEFGLEFYVRRLRDNITRTRLENVLSWLRIQTAEKYKRMHEDLSHVAKILFGGREETSK